MRLWLILIGTLLIQEIASTNIVLLTAHRAGYSGLLIFLVFLGATSVDLVVGYTIGKYVQRRYAKSQIVARGETFARRFHQYMGMFSERAMLVLMGFVSYVYVNAFLASWLDLSVGEIFFWTFLGDLGWYGLTWLFVLGVRTASPNFSTELYLLVGISIAFIILLRYIASRVLKKR